MNYLFLLNASILLFLGPFLYYRNRDVPSFRLLIFNLGVASWSICSFLINELPLVVNVNLVSKIQLFSSLIFVNGLFYFCSSYPVLGKSYLKKTNLACFSLLSFAILFTDSISFTFVENGEIVSEDHPFGFFCYFLYASTVAIGALITLYLRYKKYPEFRDKIKFLYIGVATFMVCGGLFNVLFPLFGIYNFLIIGRLSSIFPALFFAYVITKHDFMDITVIINKNVSWILTFLVMTGSYLVSFNLAGFNTIALFISSLLLALFWAVMALPLQQFMLTSARRKFIRSWYEPDDVISEIAGQLTVEKDRESIFIILLRVLDEVFQLEKHTLIIAVRNNDESVTHYEEVSLVEGIKDKGELEDTTLVENYEQRKAPEILDDCDSDTKDYLISQGYKLGRQCLVVPFYSPEFLEGIVIMGERSNQADYSERDLRFMVRLVSYISAILYRLTPFEKLEKLYFDNRAKLHDAEIQLIRAQKIEAIAHATRQCHHEIRTPLNIIKLGIGRINSMEDLESYKAYASEEVSRALEIVDETLTITDVSEANKERLSNFDINEVIRRSVRVVDLERYQLDLAFNNLPEFMGNFSDMQVVIANLIHNAMDAMPDGGKLAFRTYTEGDNIVIEVEDTGIGIDDNSRSKVWEPYFSGKETEVGNSTAGRGWGLTIVNRIITEHDGTINFSSQPGEGTTFTIILPVKKNWQLKAS
jgi:signal transduction histidine kinase